MFSLLGVTNEHRICGLVQNETETFREKYELNSSPIFEILKIRRINVKFTSSNGSLNYRLYLININ